MRLKISEIFCSLQGEGSRVGEPSVFLRLAGCNLQCVHCDTKYSWQEYQELDLEEVFQKILSYKIKNLVITGGEPTLQAEPLIELLNKLLQLNYSITIETNGSIHTHSAIDLLNKATIVSFSPKLKGFLGREYNWETFIRLLKEIRTNFYIKLVATESTKEELAKCIKRLSKVKKNLEIFLQPDSSGCSNREDYIERARKLWKETVKLQQRETEIKLRMVPQLHRMLFWEVDRGL